MTITNTSTIVTKIDVNANKLMTSNTLSVSVRIMGWFDVRCDS